MQVWIEKEKVISVFKELVYWKLSVADRKQRSLSTHQKFECHFEFLPRVHTVKGLF